MHAFQISVSLNKTLKKLSKKDKGMYEQVIKKIDEIVRSHDVEHYKNLKNDLKDYKRAHIGPFVLTFRYNKDTHTLYFEDYDHHDKIYK